MLVIGIGTGRCGTVSLAQLLNAQPRSRVTHEAEPWLPWRKYDATPSERAFLKRAWGVYDPLEPFEGRVRRFEARQHHYDLIGDVGFFWLPYVYMLRAHFPDVKVVGLWRDKESYVESAMKKTGGEHGINFWDCPKCESWSLTFPQFPGIPKREAVEKYWDFYNQRLRRHSDYMMQMEDLNSEEKQDELFDVLGLSDHEHVFGKHNVGPNDLEAANGVREDEHGNPYNLVMLNGQVMKVKSG